MITKSGCNIVHLTALQWQDRTHNDQPSPRVKTYWHDVDNDLTLRLIDQPANAIVSRQPHIGTHVSTLLKGHALIDGLTLNPMDVIVGPGNEPSGPQGPITYPAGCQLFSCFQGSDAHTEAAALCAAKSYRLIQSEQTPWDAKAGGALHMKSLVADGAGRLMLSAMRLSAGFTVPVGSRPHLQAALVVDGSAVVDGEVLGPWDFMYMAAGVAHGPIHFPNGATLLMVAMRAAA